MLKTYKWTVEIEVEPLWVADGFDIGKWADEYSGSPEVMVMMGNAAQWFTFNEARVKVISAPEAKAIRAEQGYGPKEGGAK